MSELKSKYNFSSLMNERHSARNFQKKEIPENLLKEIITTAQRASSWENSQPWNVYVATGEVLEQIRKEFRERSKKKIKGNADMNPGHRTNFSDQGEKTWKILCKIFLNFAKIQKWKISGFLILFFLILQLLFILLLIKDICLIRFTI